MRRLITVTSAATNKAVCQRTRLKHSVGIAAGDTSEDSRLDYIIEQVAAFLETPAGLGRPPYRQTYTERAAGTGGDLMLLSRWPIESVSSVTYGIDDPETVDSSDYSIVGERRDKLYAPDGWSLSSQPVYSEYIPASGSALSYLITYTAGYLMPGQTADWAATTAYTTASWVRPTDDSKVLRYLCTTAGTSGSSQPTWPTTVGGTVVDGTATWTCYEATEMPNALERCCILIAKEWYLADLRDPLISSRNVGTANIGYMAQSAPLSLAARALLEVYR